MGSRSRELLLLVLCACPPKVKTLGGYVSPPPDGTRIVCPVTADRCTKDPSTESAVFEMRTFYFCTDGARLKFGENPGAYAYR